MENALYYEHDPCTDTGCCEGRSRKMTVFYINALSESMVTFLLYVLSILAVLSTYKLIPRRVKKFVSDSLSFASEGVPTRHA